MEAASQEDVLVLLLEGALERVDKADAAMAAGDRVAWNTHLHTVRAIFIELQIALDPAGPPDLIGSLRNTYGWVIHHATSVAKTGDRAVMVEIRRVVALMYETWAKAVAMAREGGESDMHAESADGGELG
jgi:flagellin-specific chaperone FliS